MRKPNTIIRFVSVISLMALGATAGCDNPGGDDPADAAKDALALPDPVDQVMAQPADNCVPNDAQDTFAACICENFAHVGRLKVLRGEPGTTASVGVNGTTEFVNDAIIEGSWHAYDGFEGALGETSRIDGNVVTPKDFAFVGKQTVGHDLWVGGALEGVGDLTVNGALALGGAQDIVGEARIGAEVPYRAPAAAPCVCDGYADIAAMVAAVASTNDNASAGLTDEGIVAVGDETLTLQTGHYYLPSIDAVGKMSIRVEGQVAIYIDGNVDLVGEGQFDIAPGAALDLYVAATVSTVGDTSFGNPADSKAFRLFIGGEESTLAMVGDQAFYGHLFAPGTTIALVGDTTIIGSLLAKSIEGVGDLRIEHHLGGEGCNPDPEEPVGQLN